MSTAQSAPPSLDGFTFISWLGGGGFADVFLYQQHLPERRVAVKVLRETVDDEEALRNFNAEANLMARVSTHPNIVSIYSAGVSNDRRPYLVMEFYPLAHYGERIKQARLPVHEVLEVGIKVGSAIETAHRNHIVHRDIKPANILSSDFGEPGLTDFGISGTQTEHTSDESMGFSPPYAPPEILADESPGDERSDIYSLAATLWAMLAGHSPFELAGQKNLRSDVIRRGLNESVPRLPRSDVPASLEYALQHALAKDPSRRPASARSFAMTLQGVEQELGYRPTPLNLVQDASTTGPAVIDGPELLGERTKIGRGKVVNPDGPVAHSPTAPVPTTRRDGNGLITSIPTGPTGAPRLPAAAISRLELPDLPDEPGTIKITRAAPNPDPAPAVPERRMPKWMLAVAAVAVVVLVAVGVAVMGGDGSSSRPPVETAATEPVGDLGAVVTQTLDPIAEPTFVREGNVVHFSWTHAAADGLQFLVQRTDAAAASSDALVVDVPTIDIEVASATETPCIVVTAFIAAQVQSDPSAPWSAT